MDAILISENSLVEESNDFSRTDLVDPRIEVFRRLCVESLQFSPCQMERIYPVVSASLEQSGNQKIDPLEKSSDIDVEPVADNMDEAIEHMDEEEETEYLENQNFEDSNPMEELREDIVQTESPVSEDHDDQGTSSSLFQFPEPSLRLFSISLCQFWLFVRMYGIDDERLSLCTCLFVYCYRFFSFLLFLDDTFPSF